MSAWEQTNPYSLPASADLSAYQYRFMNLDSTGRLALSSDGGRAITVLQNKPSAPHAAGSCCRAGDPTKVVYGGAVAKGALVSSDSAGKCVTAGTGDKILGQNLDQVGVSGEIGTIILLPLATT